MQDLNDWVKHRPIGQLHEYLEISVDALQRIKVLSNEGYGTEEEATALVGQVESISHRALEGMGIDAGTLSVNQWLLGLSAEELHTKLEQTIEGLRRIQRLPGQQLYESSSIAHAVVKSIGLARP